MKNTHPSQNLTEGQQVIEIEELFEDISMDVARALRSVSKEHQLETWTTSLRSIIATCAELQGQLDNLS